MANCRRGWERQMTLSCVPALMEGGCAPHTNDVAAAVTAGAVRVPAPSNTELTEQS